MFTDSAGNIVKVNKQCSEVFGVPTESLLQMNYFDLIDETPRLAIFETFGQSIFKTGLQNSKTIIFSLARTQQDEIPLRLVSKCRRGFFKMFGETRRPTL